MLRNRTIITPLNLDWDRPADFQRQTCLELAKKNQVIVYAQHKTRFFLKEKATHKFPKLQNISFYVPTYFIPFRRLRIIELLNRNLSFLIFLLKTNAERKIFWFFESDFVWMLKFAKKSDVTLYDCVDDGLSYKAKNGLKSFAQEVQFATRVKLFFTNSLSLAVRYGKIRKATWIKHAGFDLSCFVNHQPSFLSQEKKKNKRPRVGFVGCIDNRVDFIMLASIASRLQHVDFILCGPIKSDAQRSVAKLIKLPNTQYLPGVARSRISSVISNFDVCIIPYKLTTEVFFSLPTKLFEYFFVGKPVLSTPILELHRFSKLIYIEKSAVRWHKVIRKLLLSSFSDINILEQQKVAKSNSWERKISAISKKIAEHKKKEF